MDELKVPIITKREDSPADSTGAQVSEIVTAAQMNNFVKLENSLDSFTKEEDTLLSRLGDAFSFFVTSVGFFVGNTALVVFVSFVVLEIDYKSLVVSFASLSRLPLIFYTCILFMLAAAYVFGIVAATMLAFDSFKRLDDSVSHLQMRYRGYYKVATTFVNEVLTSRDSIASFSGESDLISRIQGLTVRENVAPSAIFYGYKILVIIIACCSIGVLLMFVPKVLNDVLKELGK